jgi:hypothetical protein
MDFGVLPEAGKQRKRATLGTDLCCGSVASSLDTLAVRHDVETCVFFRCTLSVKKKKTRSRCECLPIAIRCVAHLVLPSCCGCVVAERRGGKLKWKE